MGHMKYNQPTIIEDYDFQTESVSFEDIFEWFQIMREECPQEFGERTKLGMYEVSRIDKHKDCPQTIKDLYKKVRKEYGPIYKCVGFLAIDDNCTGYGWHNDAWNLVVANYMGGPTMWEFKEHSFIMFPNNKLMYIPKTARHQVTGTQARFSIAFCLENR